jgi:hypothetical protein
MCVHGVLTRYGMATRLCSCQTAIKLMFHVSICYHHIKLLQALPPYIRSGLNPKTQKKKTFACLVDIMTTDAITLLQSKLVKLLLRICNYTQLHWNVIYTKMFINLWGAELTCARHKPPSLHFFQLRVTLWRPHPYSITASTYISHVL